MLRLRDDQWDRIREHFPEEHIPDTRSGRKLVPTRSVLEAVLWYCEYWGPMAPAPSVLSELQNRPSAISTVVSTRGTAGRPDPAGEHVARQRRVR